MPDDTDVFGDAWARLVEHNRRHPADLVILNEVPFDSWFGTTPKFDPGRWEVAVARHIEGIQELDALGTNVIGTAPITVDEHRFNRAFSWSPDGGVDWWRRKSRIPDEEPVFEASWYEAADDPPDVRHVAGARVGTLICTELWAMDWASNLGRHGAQLIATPRATGADTTDKWIAAGRVAATVSGCYSISSNRSGAGFGGVGWIIGPDGDILATTGPEHPFATIGIDLTLADRAKTTFPRYALWKSGPDQE